MYKYYTSRNQDSLPNVGSIAADKCFFIAEINSQLESSSEFIFITFLELTYRLGAVNYEVRLL
jgi:hypothetical protein